MLGASSVHSFDRFNLLSPVAPRTDLQLIRGIAIIGVVLFHFFPDHFSNGYIGVDQFFVLSGFLMSMMTERQKRFGPYEMAGFYYRRARRILPLYYLVVLICAVISKYKLFGYPMINNRESISYAANMITNIKATDSFRTPLIQLTIADDMFTHTWSIALEMQFYIIFPVFILVFRSLHKYLAYAFLLLVGESTSFTT
ncbi:unnamed protein product [Heligmosomoides polygyrus]|uniref:Acyl_transf_3 domain-containing protein n=1 Tax=Heligmosomoides polygyrus TaxID=6339 RepID=A0A183FDU6_HELPZ|nr:unnamed protein product [Heligmosomoides polygyrus]